MVKFKGRSLLNQYLPKKTVKRGLKVWCMVDATNGYITNFEVYTGKGEMTECSLGARVVKTISVQYRQAQVHTCTPHTRAHTHTHTHTHTQTHLPPQSEAVLMWNFT